MFLRLLLTDLVVTVFLFINLVVAVAGSKDVKSDPPLYALWGVLSFFGAVLGFLIFAAMLLYKIWN